MGPHILDKPNKLPKHILRKSTIRRFGHDPAFFRSASMRSVRCKCVSCGKKRTKAFRYAVKQTKCIICHNKENAVKYRKHNSNRMKLFYKNGGRHPMKGKHHSEKTKELIRSKNKMIRGKNHPSYGRRAAYGKGEWYRGSFMRSSYELAYAKYLDSRGIKWVHEPKCFPIVYEFGGEKKEGTFLPDFWLPKSNMYIEIKGWWRFDAKEKFDAFVEQYPEFRIKLFNREKLLAKGIKVR